MLFALALIPQSPRGVLAFLTANSATTAYLAPYPCSAKQLDPLCIGAEPCSDDLGFQLIFFFIYL